MLLIFGKLFVIFIIIDGAVSDSIITGDESSPGIPAVDDLLSNTPVQSAIRNEYNISFHLFTRENPQEGYSLYAKEKSINNSPFDPSDRTVFIVHGYSIELPKWKSAFFDIKDELLIFEDLNVIVVNWTEYNNENYLIQETLTVPIVGSEIAKLIHSLKNVTGILPQSVYLVGHSLGAHVSGYAGKHVSNLGRITALDAAGPGYENFPEDRRLTRTDALFVDAIHTSGALLIANGLGVLQPFADQDYFPNGGTVQPQCTQQNAKFFYTDKTEGIVDSIKERITCNHDIAPYYFAESINNCDFVAYKCDSYRNFRRGECSNSITSRMGFHARPIRNLPKMSKFYLRTTNKSPYCL